MKISLDTFKARCRAALGDMIDDGSQPLFVWLARLEHRLSMPQVERRAAALVSTKEASTSADACRANDWAPGTVIIGAEGYECDAIRIDYVGRRAVLATHLAKQRNLEPTWHAGSGIEQTTALIYRDWRPATAEELAAIEAVASEVDG
jgi:hypothetical protein